MCLKPLPYLQTNNLHYCENGKFSSQSLGPSPPPPISMLEKLFRSRGINIFVPRG